VGITTAIEIISFKKLTSILPFLLFHFDYVNVTENQCI
jgi:hypothetical protein